MASLPAYCGRLLSLLRRKGRSLEDSEDLIQEALLRLHVYGATTRVANEEAFLRRTVSNLAIDQRRRTRPDIWQEVPMDQLDVSSPLIASGPSPEAALQADQFLSEITQLLEAVSPRTREIYLAHRAGYSYDEISGDIGLSHITIKRHVARGLLAIMEYRKTQD